MTHSDRTATLNNRTDSTRSLTTHPGRPRHPYPGAPAPAVSARDGAPRASAPTRHHTVWTGPIPATVWACGPIPLDPNARWPTGILTKIVTSFSAPGDRIILLHCPAPTGGLTDHGAAVQSDAEDAELAAALAAINDLHRTPRVIHFQPTATASGSTSPPLCADLLSSSPDSPHPPRTDPLPGSTADAAAIHLDTANADADLVITSLDSQHSGPCVSDHMTLLAARLLRAGGVLAVLTHSDWSKGELFDPTGPLVACAQNAGLLYLQHIIALHAPLRHRQPPSATTVTTTPAAHERGCAASHRRISSDVLVFAQHRDHQQSPTFATRAETEPMQ
jgi:hypothetical protein